MMTPIIILDKLTLLGEWHAQSSHAFVFEYSLRHPSSVSAIHYDMFDYYAQYNYLVNTLIIGMLFKLSFVLKKGL